MQIKIKTKESGPCRKQVSIVIPVKDVAAEYEQVLNWFVNNARIPGFREGRAPRKVAERRYAGAILEETRDRLVPRSYHMALEQEKIVPVGIINVRNDALRSKDEPFAFDVTVDVPPRFKLPRYQSMSLKLAKLEVTDQDVNNAFDNLLDRTARYEDVSDGAVEEGDLVRIDYSGTVEGRPVVELGSDCAPLGAGTDFWVHIGGRDLLPGLSKALVGARIGGGIDVSVDFPAGYQPAAVSGKTAAYKVCVKGIRKKRRPEVDEKFLKMHEAESTQSLRDRIRTEIEKLAEERRKGMVQEGITRYLLDETNLDLPQSVVEEEIRYVASDMVSRAVRQGASKEQIVEHRDNIMSAAARSSGERVKLMYILSRIAEEENIVADDAETAEFIQSIAERRGIDYEKLRKDLEKGNVVESIKADIRTRKTLDFLAKHARIKWQ